MGEGLIGRGQEGPGLIGLFSAVFRSLDFIPWAVGTIEGLGIGIIWLDLNLRLLVLKCGEWIEGGWSRGKCGTLVVQVRDDSGWIWGI